MVTEMDQLLELFEIYTTYSGARYPTVQSIDQVNESLPKFLITPIYEPAPAMDHVKIRRFKIHLQAASEALLETAIAKFLSVRTVAPTGYKKLESTITLPVTSVSNSIDTFTSVLFPRVKGTELAETYYDLAVTTTPDTVSILYMSFAKYQGWIFTGNTATLNYTLISQTGTAEFNVYQYKSNTLAASIPVGTSIAGANLIQLTNDDLQTNGAITQDLTTTLESLVETYDYYTLFLQANEGAHIDKTGITLTLSLMAPTTYPFFIDVKAEIPYSDNNQWFAELECEARWVL